MFPLPNYLEDEEVTEAVLGRSLSKRTLAINQSMMSPLSISGGWRIHRGCTRPQPQQANLSYQSINDVSSVNTWMKANSQRLY
jgi:hypothetical protein